MQLHDLASRLAGYFQAGGDIMYPLIILSLIMWTLAILKGIRFVREWKQEVPAEACLDYFQETQEAGDQNLSVWQKEILADYMRDRCDDPDLNRETLGVLRMRQESKVMRHIGTILILAAIAPLLGLLGTVTGMISTFDVIAQFGTGNARALASGISEALITTQSGLVVAVPGLIMGGLLFRRAEKLKGRIELFCIALQEHTDGFMRRREG
ncbi:MotA/TolQ/ExbB proton channel family protein [Pseudodesulfovibrio piezophilus]|uniref:MotA/TolQ/ExbB proton channel n=1 Tax=Pseudodesulfovibrio piezophilus (strain DSM 21447 / JCM 15486 / C1TLV30) TaxID=1322246 RepID=M1WUG9_PSEP2|nr:MotA/TolQ/ExbB proton channel family protein [Pseudodesulfovibrio piezophilus]CCH47318.1 MotA/TolQ/ExbB proton channel [Pseudodesulfovibrio piezophilus C1TLV30]